jgi:hypothetical protein
MSIGLHEAVSLIRSLCQTDGIFKGEKRMLGSEVQKVQFYTFKRPRSAQGELLPEPARRDPLVAFLFGEAK